ncbi:hypothetical protein CTEN210_10356 [Chaetoceros tenuissimus]|uniref:RING-type domain-containing protein n=1 Tax=Chaetoceros tenuissimus TaxID=426638 RepID=A0AAD3CZI5_9STRA|nr:hypothetical protein CTEN210_10356 [Chaetoceros tenuissimus]
MSSISLLRPEEVPNEFICAICFSVPLEPNLLPCEHIFCADCIKKAFETQLACPTCRISCAHNQAKELNRNSLASRIWSSIQVKCDHSEKGCAWTGSISDLKSHRRNCSSKNRGYGNQYELDNFKEENNKLKAELKEKQDVIDALKTKIETHTLVPKIPYSNYQFNRSNVVELAQLISRYLENKPYEIDRNRIYQCVQNCYRDLEANYSDNPPYYHMDMHMLLTTCVASTWFTTKQKDNIRHWINSQFNN